MVFVKIFSECIIVIIPIFIILFIGYTAKQMGWIRSNSIDCMNKIVFYISFPAFIIDEMSAFDFSRITDIRGPIVFPLTVIIVAIIGYLSALAMKKPISQVGVWAQASFRANTAFFGIPLILIILGDGALQYSALTLSIGIPMMNIVSVIVLTLPYDKNRGNFSLLRILKINLKNPLIIACIIGFLFSFIRPTETIILDKVLGQLKYLTSPLALIAIGGTIRFEKDTILLSDNFIPVLYKLFLAPLVAVILLYLMNANELDFIVTTLLVASPVTVFSYIMVAQMQGDKNLAATLILASSLFSFISYTFVLVFLRFIGFNF